MGHKNNKRKKRKALVEKKARSRPENTSTKRPDNIAAELNDGLRFQQAGRFKEAAEIYQQILSKQPSHADALHLLGFLAHQTGDDERAEQLIRRAIQGQPECRILLQKPGSGAQSPQPFERGGRLLSQGP
jgi:tetratricopeptide (TPR) repeat protein